MTYSLKDLLDISRLQELFDSLNELHSLPSAVLDTDGTILIATGWQDICTKFHRINGVTKKKCLESDLRISKNIAENMSLISYECPMGLMEAAIPLIIGGKHLGNVFVGQFLLHPPDQTFFAEQAQNFGFDEAEYLTAAVKIPVYTEETYRTKLVFIGKLVQMLVEQGYQRKQQERTEQQLLDALKTVERQAEELQKSTVNLNATLNATVDGILAVDVNRKILFFNQKFATLWNIPKDILDSNDDETLLGHVLEQLIDPDAFIKEVIRLYDSEENGFDTLYFKDGSVFERYSIPMKQAGSRHLGRVWSFRDVTERKKIEAEVSTSNKLLQTIINTAPVRVFWKDKDLRYLGCNIAFAKDAGMNDPSELIGKDDYQLVWRGQAESYRAIDRSVIDSGTIRLSFDELQTSPTGDELWLRTSKVPLKNETNQIIGVLGIYEDITEYKKTEIDLKSSQQQLATLIEALPDAVYLKNGEGRWQFVNVLGQELFRMVDLPWQNKNERELMLLQPEAADGLQACIMSDELAWQSNCSINTEEHVTTKDGQQHIFDVIKIPLFEDNGERKGLVVIGRDVTERRKMENDRLELERQLLQAQKMESLGVLAGGIAHDFNNILAIIIGRCGLAKIDSTNTDEHIIHIENAADRAAELCRQMLAYAGKSDLSKKTVNLFPLVDEMVGMLRSTISQNVIINFNFSSDILPVNADSSQIRQIVMNLIINASEAIGENRGEINIKLSKLEITKEQTVQDHLGNHIAAGWYACFEITDNGCGMDDETKHRIFEPFYTTKFTGRGLGMAATLGIIKSHNGVLQLISQQGKGTTFRIFLPVLYEERMIDAFAIHTAKPEPWKGRGSILLVEDEEEVRMIARTILIKMGFTVIEASNGMEALEQYKNNAAEIILVVTDLGMPIMDGYELFEKLKQVSPELPIIISSGFGDDVVTSRIPHDQIAGLVRKPYKSERLLETLKSILT